MMMVIIIMKTKFFTIVTASGQFLGRVFLVLVSIHGKSAYQVISQLDLLLGLVEFHKTNILVIPTGHGVQDTDISLHQNARRVRLPTA